MIPEFKDNELPKGLGGKETPSELEEKETPPSQKGKESSPEFENKELYPGLINNETSTMLKEKGISNSYGRQKYKFGLFTRPSV